MEVISDMGEQWWDNKYGRETYSAAKKKNFILRTINFFYKLMRQLFELISDFWKENGST